MVLANNFCPDIKFLNHSDAGQQFFYFDDKDKSVLSVFWLLIHQLEQDTSSCLVLESQKDAEFLYYLISRYQLSELCIILSGETPEINSNTLAKIKDALGSPPDLDADLRIANTSYTQQWKYAVQNLKALKKDCIPGVTTSELLDRIHYNTSNTENLSAISTIPITSEKYAQLRDVVLNAEKMYLNSFSFLDVDFPFSNKVTEKFAFTQLTEVLEDFLDGLNVLLKEYSKIESQVLEYSKQTFEHYIRKIKKEIEVIDSITVTDDMEASNTIRKKRDFHFGKLLHLYNGHEAMNTPFAQSKMELIHHNIYESDSFISESFQKHHRDILSGIHKIDAFKTEADNLLVASDTLIKAIVDSGIIESFSFGSAAQMVYQKKLLLDFKNEISSALHFLDNNEIYYSWRIFMSSLDRDTQSIILHLAEHSNNWPLDLDRLFYRQMNTRFRLQLDSPSEKLDLLKAEFNGFVNAQMHEQKTKTIEKSLWSSMESLDWENLITKHAADLSRRFPMLIIGRKVYLNNKKAIEKAYGKTIFFDCLGDKMNDFEASRNLFVINNQSLQQAIDDRLKLTEEQWCLIDGPVSTINRPLNQLSRSELHRASMYLANELDMLNASHRIFQMKDAAIISYWSDIKNARLISAFNASGIKEIISDNERINLLPAIFANLEQSVFFLIEDGLFVKDENNILRQLNLLESFKNAQLKVINIDNLEIKPSLNKALEKIEIAIQSQHIESVTN